MTTRQAAMLARASLATLVRTVPVRVLDVSRCGCGIESLRDLPAGTVGQLRVSLEGQSHQDDCRIARCQVRHGAGSSYQLGVELLDTRRMNASSVRWAIGQLVDTLEERAYPLPRTTNQALPDRESEQLAKGVSRAPPAPAGVETKN